VSLDWPAGWDRTPESEREDGNKFSAGFRRSKKELRDELERLGAEDWRLDDVTGGGGDPGVVLRWTLDGSEHAAACDAYTTKAANLRATYLWLRETRMRNERPVRTGNDGFAAARLPSGEEDGAVVGREPPHEVLNVRPDAPDAVVKGAARSLKAEHHPDNGGDKGEFKRVTRAERAMLGEEA
jgi:hypothetical protein